MHIGWEKEEIFRFWSGQDALVCTGADKMWKKA